LKPVGKDGKPVPEAADPTCASTRPTPPRASSPSATASSTRCRSIPGQGALYQVYAAPGQITDIALQPGEQLVGAGPVAAGDTVRWIIGDTESGAGGARQIHILVKPTRPELLTNLVINTDRRTYHMELRSTPSTYMASVSWQYPQDQLIALRRQNAEAQAAQPVATGIDLARVNFRYDRGRSCAVAPAARLRRRPAGVHRVSARHRPGRDAAAVRRRRGGRHLRAGELPRARQLHDRRPAVRRRRAALRGRQDQKRVRIVRTDGRPAS
jgi:type IV secretion system protein VirB9